MILSLEGQCLLFLNTVLIGMAVGLFYDFFRTIRSLIRHPNVLVSFEDIVYWIVAVFVMFFYMLQANDGEIRPFSIFGVFIGMVLYFALPSKIVMSVSSTIVMIIKTILKLFFEILFTPFRILDMIFGKLIRKLIKKIKRFFKKVLHSIKMYVKINLKKLKHFVKVIFTKT